MRIALDGAKAGKETLKARLVKLRAVGATLSKLPSDEAAHLRAALRRSRRQKTTINVLSKENARLRRAVKGSRTRPRSVGRPARQASRDREVLVEVVVRRRRRVAQDAAEIAAPEGHDQIAVQGERPGCANVRRHSGTGSRRWKCSLRGFAATGAVLSRALFGRKSEKQETPRSGRPRGQQRGAPGHGRTQRPGLEERTEELKPPEGGACVLLLRKGLCRQRCRRIHPRRDRGQGPQACDPPSALAPGLRLRVVADRSVGAPGAAAVPQDALRDQLLGRASCSNTAPASAPCTGLPRGCPARGCRSRRGRWPTA